MNYKQYNEELIEENYKLREENILLQQAKDKLQNDYQEARDRIDELISKIDKAIELTKNFLKTEDRGYYQIIFKEILKSLGDKENE